MVIDYYEFLVEAIFFLHFVLFEVKHRDLEQVVIAVLFLHQLFNFDQFIKPFINQIMITPFLILNHSFNELYNDQANVQSGFQVCIFHIKLFLQSYFTVQYYFDSTFILLKIINHWYLHILLCDLYIQSKGIQFYTWCTLSI